jgi:hypothetical protein
VLECDDQVACSGRYVRSGHRCNIITPGCLLEVLSVIPFLCRPHTGVIKASARRTSRTALCFQLCSLTTLAQPLGLCWRTEHIAEVKLHRSEYHVAQDIATMACRFGHPPIAPRSQQSRTNVTRSGPRLLQRNSNPSEHHIAPYGGCSSSKTRLSGRNVAGLCDTRDISDPCIFKKRNAAPISLCNRTQVPSWPIANHLVHFSGTQRRFCSRCLAKKRQISSFAHV